MLRVVSITIVVLAIAGLAFSVPVKAQDQNRLAGIAALSGRWDFDGTIG